uniref:Claudin b n=1 Tax=Cyclopterus lumpus TaxID=8103 RepID=A0A8C2ZFJ9_CYCLU
MVSTGLQILGAALGILGWIGAILVCALPMWKVTAFIGSTIVTAQTTWEGIWMNCVHQSTGQMQCKVYDSMLALSSDLQAARALTILSIVVGILAILLSIAGGQCTNCVQDPSRLKVIYCVTSLFIRFRCGRRKEARWLETGLCSSCEPTGNAIVPHRTHFFIVK